jgi:cytochrome c-type biogenesis protein CcmF
VEIGVTDPAGMAGKPKNETLIVEASIKPYINLVWMGTVTLVVGFIITIVRRVQEARDRPGSAPAAEV